MHMLRLGHQGVEFLETGRLTLPMREPVRTHLMDVRQGRSNLADVLAECKELESRLTTLLETSPLPLEPNLNAFLRASATGRQGGRQLPSTGGPHRELESSDQFHGDARTLPPRPARSNLNVNVHIERVEEALEPLLTESR